MTGEPRVPAITERTQLAEEHRRSFDEIAASRGSVRGPFSVLLHRPTLAARVAALGTIVRFRSDLPDRPRELAILATARAWDCPYIWAAHEPQAREVGVQRSTAEVVASRSPAVDLPSTDGTVVRYARELLGDHEVSTETFDSAVAAFDVPGLIDLTTTVGYYSLLACVCNALRVVPDEPGSGF